MAIISKKKRLRNLVIGDSSQVQSDFEKSKMEKPLVEMQNLEGFKTF